MDGRCDKCGRELVAGESISVTGVGERCYGCFNEEIAARMGVESDDTPFQPIELADASGVKQGAQRRRARTPADLPGGPRGSHGDARVPPGRTCARAGSGIDVTTAGPDDVGVQRHRANASTVASRNRRSWSK
jgi:hypothetical protein